MQRELFVEVDVVFECKMMRQRHFAKLPQIEEADRSSRSLIEYNLRKLCQK
jgi:hypothetical protein